MRTGRILLATTAVMAMTALLSPIASATDATGRGPVARPAITILTPELLRLDKQDDTNNLVVFAGMDAKSKARVNWGDDARAEAARGRCSTRTALAHPDWCSVSLSHAYDDPGTYTITAVTGTTRLSKLVTISPAPVRWSPPEGWTQPAGWALTTGSATYFPCQTVAWYLDRAGQPADGGQIYADIGSGLAMLAERTGLAFTETTDAASADLTFSWGDTGGHAGLGGGWAGTGHVTFDAANWWPRDQWPGFGVVHQPNGSYAIGHGWLVVHEVMHALGLGHVNDPTSVMNPVSYTSAFNPADIEGLSTLYLNNPCPVG